MKQTSKVLCTYTADVSGVCSALYELGGLTVMHDASGCNSTYNTHDEPRWYDIPSMVYISGLTEIDAVTGTADQKLIRDIEAAATELHPRFIAIAGTPIPTMTGTDLPAIARIIEKRTGIPAFGFPTTSMNSYQKGAGPALAAIAERFCDEEIRPLPPKAGAKPLVNLLGLTPLDFSVNTSVQSMTDLFTSQGYKVVSCWAMGSTLEQLSEAGLANVNVVVSSSGIETARLLNQRYGTPYVIGQPLGSTLTGALLKAIDKAALTGKSQSILELRQSEASGKPMYVIGEAITSASLKYHLIKERGLKNVRTICPLEPEPELRRSVDNWVSEEEDIIRLLADSRAVMGDPLYRRALPCGAEIEFHDLPHEAYSGRIYRKDIPDLIGEGIK